MATTHDLRYEDRPASKMSNSNWAWIIPLAVLVLAALLLWAYVASTSTPQSTNSSLLNSGTTQSQTTGNTGGTSGEPTGLTGGASTNNTMGGTGY